ncbi:MAG: adenylyl-sulfate kinase [Bacteroidetes bacterium]|nr:adenylyl-sulfate kinase [Bacteroidota bacterium]
MSQPKELYPVRSKVMYKDRVEAMGQIPLLIWFTGLSGSGKSTLAIQLESLLFKKGYKTYLLEGDTIRTGLNSDLSFSEEGRNENMRRIAEVAKLMVDAGMVVLAAFVSPWKKNRDLVKKIVGADRYFEVFVDAPLEVCEQRDVKGLYKKARTGELKDFTGISSPYERPEHPNVAVQTDKINQEEAINLLLKKVEDRIKP